MKAVINEPIRGAVPPAWFWALPGIERIRTLSQGLLPAPPAHLSAIEEPVYGTPDRPLRPVLKGVPGEWRLFALAD